MIKLAGIIVVSLILIIFIRDTKKEFSLLLSIAVGILVFMSVTQEFYSVVETISSLVENSGEISSYISLMLKILGISLLGQFVIDLCRDNGENALATQTEIAIKIVIISMTLPLIETVIKIVTGLLK